MDHGEAIRLGATEKYVLGELPQSLRDEFEEHYFECQECALDVKAAAAFVDNARKVLRHKTARSLAKGPNSAPVWFALFRPLVAALAVAALLLIVSYQSFVTIPKLQREAAAAKSLGNANFVSLIGANPRGTSPKVFQIHRDRLAILEIDIHASGEFTNYVCQVLDASGRTIYENRVSAADAKNTVHLILPNGALVTGDYSLAVLGEGGAPYSAGSRSELERLTFSVEMLR